MDIQRGFRIGPWEVSPLTGEIKSAARTVHLEPKVMEVLVALADKAESVVLREELLGKVWGARAAVSDEPLTRCIAQLRQALGDSSRNPEFVQTVPKRGYRLMVPAESVDGSSALSSAKAAGDARLASAETSKLLTGWQRLGAAAALIVLGVVAFRALPLLDNLEDYARVDPCNIEQVSALRRIDSDARALCAAGVDAMGIRGADTLDYAMGKFRDALAIDDEFGSAYVQLARVMVLLPTYVEFVDPADCWYDENEDEPSDCYEGATRLIERNRRKVSYIDPFVYGIEGYVATKQRRWFDAEGWFVAARDRTPTDADMWQWLSQFWAAVGDLEGAFDAITEAYELNRESGVIRERYGVLAMWLGDDAKAKEMFDLAAELNHNHYEAAWLVLNIRLQEWEEVRKTLENIARLQRNEAPWIDALIAALQDDAHIDAAVGPVQAAIDARQLRGQYAYGAWVFLKQPERAIDAALRLIDSNPADMDVEFLFTAETKFLRQHERFREIIDALGLDEYWADSSDHCPRLFRQDGEENWCD